MREKATGRLICIIAGSILAAFLVPLAARAWSASQKISSNSAAYGEGMYRYPALAARDSNVYAMWSRRVGSGENQTDPYYDQSSDNGQTWGTDTNIQSSASTETLAPNLDLAIDSNDGVHFAWVEKTGSPPYTLYYSYTNGSAIQTIAQTTQIAAELAMEVSSNDVHVVWVQGNYYPTNVMYHRKDIGTGAWLGSPIHIHSSSSTLYRHPDMAVDGSGNLHVVWEGFVENGIILYKKRTGEVWSTDPINISDISNSYRPAIAVHDNNVYVVWCEYINSDTQYVRFRQSTNGGSTWEASERISGDALTVNALISTYLWSAIAVDSNGKIHVAFNGLSSNAGEDIHYVSRAQGGSWSSRQNVTDNNNNATIPAIAIAGNYVHLIWAEKWSGDLYDVYYRRTGVLAGLGDVYLPMIMKSY